MLRGSITALLTPLANGALDEKALERFVEWQITEGSHGLVPVGTTGESPTVTHEEHRRVIELTVKVTNRRVPVIAGAGSNSTAEAVALTRFAEEVGADAVLSVVPYYNKPTQEGLYRHFCAIAEAVDIPQILYNVPGRTVADMANDTVLRLAGVPGIIGIKDATGNIERATDLLSRRPAGFAVYSGDDATGIALMLLGGEGVISVTANVAPRLMAEMCRAALAGDRRDAVRINDRLLGLHRQLFCEANPIPVKWAVEQLGLIGSGIRLPLTPLSETLREQVRGAMHQAGVISAKDKSHAAA